MHDASVAVRIDRVTKVYGPVTALDAVSIDVLPGQVTGLVGPNGSGKTTALELACGLRRPDGGTVEVFGLDPRAIEARRSLALVPHHPTGYDELTIAEYVAFVGRLYDAQSQDDLIASLLKLFRLGDQRSFPLGRLSTGMRRQVSIVAAVALRPRVLLVDEASATLDPEAVVALREVIDMVSSGGTAVLLATQDLGFAEKVCHEVQFLVGGQVVLAGTPASLRQRIGVATLEEVLLTLIGVGDESREVRRAYAAG